MSSSNDLLYDTMNNILIYHIISVYAINWLPQTVKIICLLLQTTTYCERNQYCIPSSLLRGCLQSIFRYACLILIASYDEYTYVLSYELLMTTLCHLPYSMSFYDTLCFPNTLNQIIYDRLSILLGIPCCLNVTYTTLLWNAKQNLRITFENYDACSLLTVVLLPYSSRQIL